MTGIYVCDGTAAPQLTGECMTLIFRVNDDAILERHQFQLKLIKW